MGNTDFSDGDNEKNLIFSCLPGGGKMTNRDPCFLQDFQLGGGGALNGLGSFIRVHGLVETHTGGRAGKGRLVGCSNVNFEIALILET